MGEQLTTPIMSDPNTVKPHSIRQTRQSEAFYPLTPQTAALLQKANPPLSAADWRLWSYLVTFDPFGDRFRELPSPNEIMQQCKLSRASFYRGLAKLEQIGLFETQPIQIRVRNLRGKRKVSNLRQDSQICDSNLKTETEFSELRQNSQNGENRSPECRHNNGSGSPQTLQTDQTDQTLSLPPTERELVDFVIRKLNTVDGIKHPRAYALACLQRDRAHWEEAFQKSRQRLDRTTIPPSSPEQKNFDERESLIGLIELKRNAGQPLSAAVLQRAQALGIPLEPKATTPGATNHA
jgi:hypothetical protein